MNFLLQLFGRGVHRLRDAIQRGAIVIDVRNPHSFDMARIPGSQNIPLERLRVSLDRIRGIKKPVIICGDGRDPAAAVRFLRENGIEDVFDGGNWQYLIRQIRGFR